MPYEFLPGRIDGAALKDIASVEIERLRQRLASPDDRAEGHHGARKSVKRLRALLGLAHGALGRRSARKLDRALRDLGRQLSAGRDARVVAMRLATLAGTPGVSRALLRKLAPAIAASEGTPADPVTIDVIAARLAQSDLDGFGPRQAVCEAARMYRAGRQLLAQAHDVQTADSFHELRKALQRHMRHMQLLASLWPEEMGLREATARQAAGLLGEDHDLDLVISLLAGTRGTQKLLARCQDRQRALRLEVGQSLDRLYAEKPRQFRSRLRHLAARGEA